MKYLVLDLDETLVYSTLEAEHPDCIQLEAAGQAYYTRLRPGLHSFLNYVAKVFHCYIWTTGQQNYLESLWSYLDIDGFTLWGRPYCQRLQDGCDVPEPYEKPLRKVTEDLSQIVLVDNSPFHFAKYPLNGIDCRTWRGDPEDNELELLRVYLDFLRSQNAMQRNHQAWRLESLCILSK